MKRILFLFVGLCLISMGAFAQAPPVAWYTMTGGSLLDVSGNGNNGTAVGGPTTTTGPLGGVNGAYQFDGVDDYISLNNVSNFQLSNFPVSVSAWVNLSSNNTVDNVFRNCFVAGEYHGIIFNIVNGRVGIGYGDGGQALASSRRSRLGTTVLSPGIWYHITGVIRGPQDMSIYINGRDDCGTYSGSGGSIAYQTASGNIGQGTANAATNFFGGSIDDVRLYDRALSEEEVFQWLNPDYVQTNNVDCGNSLQLFTGYGDAQLASITWTASPANGSLSCTTCPNPMVTPLSTTVYTVTTTNAVGCSNSLLYEITVTGDCCDALVLEAEFTHDVGPGGVIDFTSTSSSNIPGGIALIEWTFGNSNSASVSQIPTPQPNISHTYAVTGGAFSACITVIDASGQCSDTFCENVLPALRRGVVAKPIWTLFPNPTRGYVFLEVPAELETETVSIQNMQGQTVLTQQVQAGTRTKLSVQQLPVGVYLVSLTGQSGTQKLVVR